MALALAAAFLLAIAVSASPAAALVVPPVGSANPPLAGLQCERPRSHPLDTVLVLSGTLAFAAYACSTRRRADADQRSSRS